MRIYAWTLVLVLLVGMMRADDDDGDGVASVDASGHQEDDNNNSNFGEEVQLLGATTAKAKREGRPPISQLTAPKAKRRAARSTSIASSSGDVSFELVAPSASMRWD